MRLSTGCGFARKALQWAWSWRFSRRGALRGDFPPLDSTMLRGRYIFGTRHIIRLRVISSFLIGLVMLYISYVSWTSHIEEPSHIEHPSHIEQPSPFYQNSPILADAKLCTLVSPGQPLGYSMYDLLQVWPSEKTRGFVYLTVAPQAVGLAVPLIQNIFKYFSNSFRYPVVVFSESPDAAGYLRNAIENLNPHEAASLGNVYVYDISRFWTVPQYVMSRHNNDTQSLVSYAYTSIRASGCSYPASLGYWLMCRFQSKGIVDIPFVQAFDYLWRIDLDAQLCGDLNFDIFAYMQKHDYWQGFLAEDTWDSCAQKLTEHVHKFVKEYNIVPVQGAKSIEDARTWYIYNNFEIFKVQFYLSKEYQLFMDFTDRSGGFFYYRWGDAPVRTQASRLFMPKEKMHEFKVGEVFYRHQAFDRCPKV